MENNNKPREKETKIDLTTKKKFRTAKIKVLGIGGAGCNAINHMIDCGIENINFVACNTDAQALNSSDAIEKLYLGEKSLKGLGAGGVPEVAENAAKESEVNIRKALEEVDLLFAVAGMGGGTGTGATPIICKIAKEMKILVIACVTKPFNFEGKLRVSNASKGIENLKKEVDSMIVISNDKLLEVYGNSSLFDSFHYADETLRQAIQSITDLIVRPSKINLDFADIKTVFTKKKNALFGIGVGHGKRKAVDATREAINCKLIEASIKGAKNAIVNFTGGATTTLFDINDSIDFIKKEAGEEINIFFGLNINKDMGDSMMVSIIGTDFDEDEIEYANAEYINQIRKSQEMEEIRKEIDKEDWEKKEDKDYSDYAKDEDDIPPFME